MPPLPTKRKELHCTQSCSPQDIWAEAEADKTRSSPRDPCTRPPSAPSPMDSGLDDVGLVHQLKREETLRRTLGSNALRPMANLARGPLTNWLPLPQKNCHTPPLFEHSDAERGVRSQPSWDSEDDDGDSMMDDGDHYLEQARRPSSAPAVRRTSPALGKRRFDQMETDDQHMPERRRTSPSRQLPPLSELFPRHSSAPTGRSAYNNSTAAPMWPGPQSPLRPALERYMPIPRKRSYESANDDHPAPGSYSSSSCSYKSSESSPYFHSRFLSDGDSGSERASSNNSMRAILEPFSGISLTNSPSPEFVQGNMVDDDDQRPAFTFDYPARPAPPTHNREINPRNTYASRNPPRKPGRPPGTLQWRVGDRTLSAARAFPATAPAPPPAFVPNVGTSKKVFTNPRPSLRIKDEWKTHAEVIGGPHGITLFKCLWAGIGSNNRCGYTAKRHLVKRHIETRHLQIKNHVCSFCDKAFPQHNSLQIHLNRHTGEMPHVCRYPNCDMAFNDPARRHKHMVDVHGYKPQGPRKRHRTVDDYQNKTEYEDIAPWTVQPDAA